MDHPGSWSWCEWKPRRASIGLVASLGILLALPQLARADDLPWMDTALAPAKRAELVVHAMTLDEKIQQIAMKPVPNDDIPGCGFYGGARHVEGIPRLRIPTLRMTNGPIGVGGGDCSPDLPATGVPTALSVAATWNPFAARSWGDIVGVETRSNAHNVFLAPGINLGRIPNNGRNFEYFGEDPYLTGVMSVNETRAIQAQGVQATAKHFAANEQETQRSTMDTIVDDRTLNELYLLPFEMSIKDAGLSAVMCSYPRVNGTFACENKALLTDALRTRWGFDGYVMSDRGATKSTVPSIKAGLDLEFASPRWFTPERIQSALAANEISVGDIDRMLQRRYTVMFRLGQFDDPVDSLTPIDFDAHGKQARKIAEQGMVLLQNRGRALPLDAGSLDSVALIGPETFAGRAKFPATGPGGFIQVNAPYSVSPKQGLENTLARLGSDAPVTYDDGTDVDRAVALAKKSAVAIVMVGDISLEGQDRSTLRLPTIDGVDQEALISAVAAANPHTVVVLKDGGPILMPWLDEVSGVLEAWYPGQEDGNAVADVLFGVSNPSGKLPMTFPTAEREAASSTVDQWPGIPVDGTLTATYSEGLEMGYRWYDANHVAPRFPFGYGLSYTRFSISKLVATPKSVDGTHPIKVSMFVENRGRRAGAEVPQVYLSLPAAADEPPKRLVGFEKVWLAPGQKKRVTITIDPAATNHPLSVYDAAAQEWRIVDGTYRVLAGDSSGDTPLHAEITVRAPQGARGR